MLASAFFIRYLTDAEQLADELEDKVKGTTLEDLEDPDLHSSVVRGRPRRHRDDLSLVRPSQVPWRCRALAAR